MIRIYADFNSTDEHGRVMLNTVGSLEDIRKHGDAIQPGAQVTLYVPQDFEVRATLIFDRVWMGVPDWSTLVRLDSE